MEFSIGLHFLLRGSDWISQDSLTSEGSSEKMSMAYLEIITNSVVVMCLGRVGFN